MEIWDMDSPQLVEMFKCLDKVEEKLRDLVFEVSTKRWLTPRELCDELGVSRRTLRRYLASGNLKHIKIGEKTTISRESLDAFLA